MTSEVLKALLAAPRDGYWHFQVSHRLVLERHYICARCHSEQLPLAPLKDRSAIVSQTRTTHDLSLNHIDQVPLSPLPATGLTVIRGRDLLQTFALTR